MADLIINAPRQGIAQSPHIGFGDVRNLDIYTVPGIAKLNNILVKKSSTTVTAWVKWIVRDPVTSANFYAIDSNGVVYNSTDSGATWASLSDRDGSGQGLGIWKNYLFVANATSVDIYSIAGGTWTTGWAGLTLTSDSDWHPIHHSLNDDKLYIGNSYYVATVEQVAGQVFAPGTATTYTADADALDLPSAYKIKCIEELGNNIYFGTWQGSAANSIRKADIFVWDGSADSFGQPIVMADYGVHAMKNIGGSLIVLAGISGTIYRCDGASAYVIGRLPMDLSGGKWLKWYPGALMYFKDKIYFGVGSDGTTYPDGIGVYSLQLTGEGNILTLEHLDSTLNSGSSVSEEITALHPVTRDTFLAAWRSGNT